MEIVQVVEKNVSYVFVFFQQKKYHHDIQPCEWGIHLFLNKSSTIFYI